MDNVNKNGGDGSDGEKKWDNDYDDIDDYNTNYVNESNNFHNDIDSNNDDDWKLIIANNNDNEKSDEIKKKSLQILWYW